jgi:oligoendopeptidase F
MVDHPIVELGMAHGGHVIPEPRHRLDQEPSRLDIGRPKEHYGEDKCAEREEPSKELSHLVYDIVKKYYGHDKGVCIVDDEIKAEWMYIPHFYYNLYVYQYATAYTASAALSERTIAGDKASTEKYLSFLSSGGSDYPINLLKKAGVDMTTSEPFELTMKKMNRVMDEMEKILDKMKK